MWLSKQNRKPQHGFTLIELLVTSALSLVLIGGSLFAFNTYQVRQTQIATAKLVMAKLQSARNRSSSGDKPNQNCPLLEGYRVRAVRNTNTYFLSVRCSGGSEVEVQQFLLAEDYVFLDSEFDITYTPQGGPVTDAEIEVDIGKAPPVVDKVYRFSILPSGVIQEQGIVEP